MTTQYDLTGTNVDYKVSDQQYMVFEETQVITLPGPAYVNSSLVVSIVLSGIATPLISGVDWSVRDSDVDTTAISKAKLVDGDFSATLAKSVTIHKQPNPQFIISITYQQLELNRIVANLNHTSDLSFTPEVLLDILQNISYLRSMTAPVTEEEASNLTTVHLLNEDLTGESEDNLIEDETHTINVPNNIQIVRPLFGAFFKDSVVITVVSSGSILTPGDDYIVAGVDISRTKASTETGGVYRHIFIVAAIVGDIRITYQAFGGEPTIKDIEELRGKLDDVLRYLNNSQFVTKDTLGQADVVDTLIRRMTQVEEKMRILTTTGAPSYGDKTNGIARLYKFTTADTAKHWFDIASLYKVSGSDDVITADRVHYRIRALYSKLMFDVIIYVNIDDPNTPFSIEIISDLSDPGYVNYQNYTNLDYRVMPEFRVIWNDVADVRSGALLQIGLSLKNIVTETVVVEDLSGNECCWLLAPFNAESITNHDDVVTLPDGESIWSKVVGTSNLVRRIAPLKQGYLGWAGSLSTAELETINVLNHTFDKRDILIEQIKYLDCQFFDRKLGVFTSAKCLMTSGLETPMWIGGTAITARTRSCEEFFHLDDLCKIKVTLTQSNVNDITVSAIVKVGEESSVNERFELRQIVALF